MSAGTGGPGLVLSQFRLHNRVFWRTPISAFFTLIFPLLLLVLFGALFGDIEIDGGEAIAAQFYAPALAVFAAASATYTNIAMSTTISRDDGTLKRWRGTPLPPWVYLAGATLSALGVALVAVVVMMAVGVVAFGVEIDVAKLPAAAVAFAVGVCSFAALGLALSALVKTAANATTAAQVTLLPMAFVSDVFIRLEDPPRWMGLIGDVLPLKGFAVAFGSAFNPFVDAPGFRWGRLAVVAAWGIAGAVVAITRFGWEPSVNAGRNRRGRRARS